MSSPPPPPKQKGWGSFLSGAVAGLESRLDNILADEADASAKSRAAEEAAKAKLKELQATAGALKAESAQDSSRASSRNRVNGRLQERLAKAVVKGTESPRSQSNAPGENISRPESPAANLESGRASLDTRIRDLAAETEQAIQAAEAAKNESVDSEQTSGAVATESTDAPAMDIAAPTLNLPEATSSRPSQEAIRPSQESIRPSIKSARPSLDAPSHNSATSDAGGPPPAKKTAEELEQELDQLRKSHEADVLERQSELHANMERIDTLQAKLSYLAKNSANTAREAASEAEGGSADKKLAEKDEQIALLMEEGQKLSKTELKHLNTIKVLRSRFNEKEKTVTEAGKNIALLERNAFEATERAKRAEAGEKSANERLKILAKIEKDVDALSREKETAGVLIVDLRRQLAESATHAEEAEKRAQSGALEKEKKVVAELREELENANIEKKLIEERGKKEVKEAKELADREKEKAKVVEVELRGEITVCSMLFFRSLVDILMIQRASRPKSNSFALERKKRLRARTLTARLNSFGK
ncbi:hypothetical protein K402DRAFT_272110 [Aulographum hederae CBS 113979]|uniref:TATA element modulatory factor 1 TATA binding domain-containing protein n=1 Tax=Aulographum hederae CBS 113979 TaxID=1176131 RepID=A0A6G1H8S1_9PEZI|nr:hypothetical protein K402DRAFT_272110 [Aulographum hederae CBS 113979]